MPKPTKYSDAVQKQPKAFDEAYQVARKSGKWKDDLDDEKNFKQTYKQMNVQQQRMIDEIFRKYNLTVVITKGNNFTILEDETNMTSKVVPQLEQFERKEDPNTKRIEELEKSLKELREQEDPLKQKTKEQQEKIKEMEKQIQRLKDDRYHRWAKFTLDVFNSTVGKMIEKPVPWLVTGVIVYVFYKVCQFASYVGSLFDDAMKSFSNYFNPKVNATDILLKLARNETNVENATSALTVFRAPQTPFYNNPNDSALVQWSQSIERTTAHAVDTIAGVIQTGMIITAVSVGVMAFCVASYLVVKYKNDQTRQQMVLDIVNAENETVGRVLADNVKTQVADIQKREQLPAPPERAKLPREPVPKEPKRVVQPQPTKQHTEQKDDDLEDAMRHFGFRSD